MDLYMLLYRAFHAQRKQLRPYMAQLGLSPGQPKILMYVSNHEGCMQKEAAESCDIEPATISRMIDTLEKGGFVKRVIPQNNRRAGNLYLTEKGEESYQLWQAHCLEVEQEMLTGFSEQEKEQVTEYLSRIYRNLSGRDAL